MLTVLFLASSDARLVMRVLIWPVVGKGLFGGAARLAMAMAIAVAVALLAQVPTAAPAGAQGSGDAPLEIVDQHGGVAYAVAAGLGRVYFGMGPRAAAMQPDPPRILGVTPALPDLVRGLEVRGDVLYVAAEDAGFYVFDFADPAAPVEVAHFETGGEARTVALDGDRAYVSSWGGGVLILDISTPAKPVEVGRYTGERGVNHTWGAGDRAYVSLQTQGVRILDVADPARPSELAAFTTAGTPEQTMLVGHLLFVADGAGVRVVDVSADDDPRLLTELPSAGYPRAMTLVDTMLFVAAGTDGVMAIDVTVPDQPSLQSAAKTSGDVVDVASDGLMLYAADWITGVYVVHGATTALQAQRLSDMPGYAQAVGVVGDGLAVANASSGVRRYLRGAEGDITPRGFLAGAGRDQTMGTVGSFAVTTDIAAATRVLAVGADTPAVVYSDSFEGKGVSVQGDHAYLSGGPNGLRVLDLSNPAEPQGVARLPLPGFAWNAAVLPPHAYVAIGDAGLAVVDVASPRSPTFIATTHGLGRAVGIAASRGFLFVAGSAEGFKVVQRTDPLSPTLGATLPTTREAVGVHVSGDRAYVALAPASLLVADVSDPLQPREIATLPTLWRIYGIAEADDYLYVAGGASGVWVLRPTDGGGQWPMRSGALTSAPAATPEPDRPTPFALQPPLVTPDIVSVGGATAAVASAAPGGAQQLPMPLKLAAGVLAGLAALLALSWAVRRLAAAG